MGGCSKRAVAKGVKSNLLLILMIIAMAVGIGMGWGLRFVEPKLTKRDIFYLRFPGDILLQMLKMLILPLIVSSLVSAMASLDLQESGRIGLRAIVYYITTTLFAVIMGIILVLSIKPGDHGDKDSITRSGKSKVVNTADALLDLIRVSFPDNLIEACFQKKITDQIPIEKPEPTTMAPENLTAITMYTYNITNETEEVSEEPQQYEPKVVTKPGMNVLGLVVFSLFFGCIISRMKEKGRILAEFFEALNDATMQLITLVIWYSPIGVLFLIAAKMVEMDDPEVVFTQLGLYCVTVIVGLIIHGYIVLPIIYFIATRKNPYRFIYGMVQAIVTALATASSSATLPVTMNCLEHNNNVDLRVAKFIAPIGATINMDGTALYEAVASIFIAQINGIALSIGQVITVSVTATAAAIGAAGVPQAGLVTMVIVLTAVGLPTEDVTVILAVDWFLDRCRTSVNVLGDALGAGIVYGLSRKELAKMDANKTKENGHTEKKHAITSVNIANGDVTVNGIHNASYLGDESTEL